jgi:polar amino acid transport system substrate-binding protein
MHGSLLSGLRLLALLVATLAPFLPVSAQTDEEPERQILYAGWFDRPPYIVRAEGSERAAGFDVELLEEAGRRVGYQFVLERMDADYARELLGEGEIDVGLNTTALDEAEDYALPTIPFRREKDMLFLSADALAALRAEPEPPRSAEALLAAAVRLGLRIGVAVGDDHGAAAEAVIGDRANARTFTRTTSDADSALLAGTGALDGFIADRLAGYQALARTGYGDRLSPWDVPVFERDVRFVFSSEGVAPATVDRLDSGLRSVLRDGTYERLEARYIEPLLLSVAVSASWFPLLDAIGTIAFAISGVLLARRDRFSLLGAFVLAALPAVGGGVVRDLLVGRRPIGILADPTALILTVLTVAVGYGLFRLYDAARGRFTGLLDLAWLFVRVRRIVPPRSVFEISDALGLAAFTVTGVVIAIRFGATPLWLWGPLLAMLTAAGGGILRDVVRSDPEIPTLKTSFYAEIALVLGLLLCLAAGTFGSDIEPAEFQAAVVVTIAGAFLTRLLVVGLRLRGPRF